MLRKVLLSVLLSVYLFTSYGVNYVHAQSTWYSQSFAEFYSKVYDTNNPTEIFGERYTAAQVTWVMYGVISFILNGLVGESGACLLATGNVTSCIQQHPLFAQVPDTYTPRGVFATLFSNDREMSGVNYVRSRLAHLNLIPEASAQTGGFGFSALGPVQGAWRAVRDVMYGLFVIVIIVFAFMIMFRVKINPQTVVTVQSALPRIIIALILVTFSYAIAGFLIDLIYVAIGILAVIIQNFGFLEGADWGGVFNLLTNGPGNDVLGLGIISWLVGYSRPFLSALLGSAWMISNVSTTAGVVSWIVSWFIIGGMLFWLIQTSVRIFILLIRTYLSILVSVIFAPFIIGFGAVIPAGGFTMWIRGLVGNLLVYPVVGALFMLSIYFLSATYPEVRNVLPNWLQNGVTSVSSPFAATGGTAFWYPPMTFGTQSQNSGWDPLPILWTFASLGLLAMIPNTANIIRALMSGQEVGRAAGIGEGLTAALGVGAGYALGASRRVGGGVLDTGLLGGAGRIERLRASERPGVVGAVQRFTGQQLSRLGESRGLRNVPSSQTGWFRRGGRPVTEREKETR